MIALARPRRRWTGRHVAAGLAALLPLAVLIAPRATPSREAPPVSWRIIPLTGAAAEDRRDAGRCAELVDELVQHPNWQLHAADRASGCTGSWDLRRLRIDADGAVTWNAPAMPERHLALTPDELARVRALNRFDCERTGEVGYGEDFYELSWGSDTEAGVHVPGSSAMAAELDGILDAAIDRYTAARLAEVGALGVELAARPRMRLRLDADGTLTVTRGRRVVSTDSLDARARVDLIDALLAGQAATAGEYDVASGHATIGARTLPLHLPGFGWPPALAPLGRALDDAGS